MTVTVIKDNNDVEKQQETLAIAQFLCFFQNFYRNNGVRDRPISALNVTEAIAYERRQALHSFMENEWEAMDKGSLSKDEVETWEKRIEASREKLMTLKEAGEEVHSLLKTFEVWSTKHLANNLLMHSSTLKNHHHGHNEATEKHFCCSPLLNLPSAKLYQKILPPIDKLAPEYEKSVSNNHATSKNTSNDDQSDKGGIEQKKYDCSLPLPPNSLTYYEYLRIAQMVSMLPTAQAVNDLYVSPMSAVSAKLMPVKEDLKLAETSKFTQVDIVALWVRAQRNSSALRHLLHIFVVSEVTQEGDVDQPSERDNAGKKKKKKDKPMPKYSAKFIGNHKNARTHVSVDTNLIDRLIAWSVNNQILFTFAHAKETIRLSVLEEQAKKKRKSSAPFPSNAKRRKLDVSAEGVDILRACHSFMLRWFARRNRKALSILFTTNFEQKTVKDSVNKIMKELNAFGVPNMVKDYMAGIGSTDRTFARIDRRLHKNKYETHDTGNTEKQTFYNAVTQLLNALVTSVPIHSQLPQTKVLKAFTDFENIYQLYHQRFLDEGAEAAAQELIESNPLDDVAGVLNSAPSPWLDRCSLCEKGWNNDPHLVCINCEAAIHTSCTVNRSTPILEYLDAFAPLKRVYGRRIPRNGLFPDFRNSKDVTWTKIDIEVIKNVNKHGQLQSLGMGIRNTEQTEQTLRKYLVKSGTLEEMVISDSDYPLAVPHQGIFVVDLAEGLAGAQAGIKKNDVITALEFVYSQDGRVVKEKHEFGPLTAAERTALCRRGIKQLKVTVQRPNLDLVRLCKKWLRRTKKANLAFRKVLESESGTGYKKLFVCPLCSAGTPSPKELESERIKREAFSCRAVIRRLGMEEYSFPFHDDGKMTPLLENEEDFRHSQYASLRRLDAMMTSIIDSHSDTKLENPMRDEFLPEPFTVPPWDTTNTKERISWAPVELEKKPLELLCRGFEWLLTDPSIIVPSTEQTEDPHREERTALANDFFSFFCSWCIASAPGDKALPRTRGPPLSAQRAKEPWLVKSCTVCGVRPRKTDDEGSIEPLSKFCNNPMCEKLHATNLALFKEKEAKAAASRMKTLKLDWAPSLLLPSSNMSRAIREYEHFSSFVGTTLLALPGDPLLDFVARALNWSIEHMDRPVLLIVASYLPGCFVERGNDAVGNDFDRVGEFHVLPVLHDTQVKYLLGICKMRQPPEAEDLDTNEKSWANLQVLNVEGIIRLSPDELKAKIRETAAIRQAVDEAVSKIARCTSKDELKDSVHTELNRPVNENNTWSSLLVPCRAVDSSKSTLTGKSIGGPTHPPVLNMFGGDEYIGYSSDKRNARNVQFKTEKKLLGGSGALKRHSTIIDSLLSSGDPAIRNLLNQHDGSNCGIEQLVGPDDDTDVGENDVDDWESISVSSKRKQNKEVESDPFWKSKNKSSDKTSPTLKAADDASFQFYMSSFMESARGFCQLCYSDLFLHKSKELDGGSMKKWLKEVKYTAPPQVSDEDTYHDMTLLRRKISARAIGERAYKGIGWGFELVVWKNEKVGIRVGRVYPLSPAAKAGFQMHDVLQSVNGKDVQTLTSVPQISCLLMGHDHKAVSGKVLAEIVNAIGMGTGGDVTGPMIVRVRRCNRRAGQLRPGGHSKVSKITSPSDLQPTQPMKPAAASMNVLAKPIFARPAQATVHHQHTQPVQALVQAPVQAPVQAIIRPQVQAPLQAPVPAQVPTQVPAPVQVPMQAQRKLANCRDFDSSPKKLAITNRDLFRLGLKGSFLSKVETAFVLEARKRHCAKLGVRLLVPRYDSEMLSSQVTMIYSQRIEPGKIPDVQEELWNFVLKYDYKRSKDEAGPIWFSEGSYSYRYPVGVLPLDRLSESFLKQKETIAMPSEQSPSHPYNTQNQQLPYAQQGQNGTSAISRPRQSMTRPHHAQQTAHEPSTEAASHQNPLAVVDLVNADGGCQRIRGGGDAPGASPSVTEDRSGQPPVRCDTLPAKDLVNAPVWGECHTLKDNKESGDAKLIGYVDNVEPENGAKGDFDVALIYVSNAGHLEEPIIQRINSQYLFKIEIGSEEDKLAKEWQNVHQPPKEVEDKVVPTPKQLEPTGESVTSKKVQSDNHDDVHALDADDHDSNVKGEKESNEKRPTRNPDRKITLKEAGHLLVERFCQKKSGPSHLGNLPDGRAVFWLQSDPRALFLRNPSEDAVHSAAVGLSSGASQRSYRAQIYRDTEARDGALPVINLCERGRHCCIWGCTINDATSGNNKLVREVLSFKTNSELQEHMVDCHQFDTGMGRFTRIEEGERICHLVADITSSTCARCLSLTKFGFQKSSLSSIGTTRDGRNFSKSIFGIEARILFSPKALLRLNEGGRGALDMVVVNNILDGSKKNESVTRCLLRLWSRITRLFDVENTGDFRLDHFDCQTNLFSKNNTNVEESKAKPAICVSENGSQDISSRELADCGICCSKAETVLCCRQSSQALSGIGCALLTELCFPGETSSIFETSKVSSGMLGTVKKLLLRVASHIPPSLCQILEEKNDVDDVKSTECSIWSDPYFDRWTHFVESSRDVRMLTQAFLLLLSSVKKKKLPTWWKSSRGGWSDAYTLMSFTSFSSLALQLYVLDAAIAEAIASNSPTRASFLREQENNPSAEQLQKLGTIEDKMETVMQWANELSLKRYTGSYNETCLQCADGGTLMCCEFCSNVQHMYCCFPPIFEEPKFDWVCDSCINDITVLRNQNTLK